MSIKKFNPSDYLGVIEVTPEMVEAGWNEFWNHDVASLDWDEMRVAVAEIYKAMLRVAQENWILDELSAEADRTGYRSEEI